MNNRLSTSYRIHYLYNLLMLCNRQRNPRLDFDKNPEYQIVIIYDS